MQVKEQGTHNSRPSGELSEREQKDDYVLAYRAAYPMINKLARNIITPVSAGEVQEVDQLRRVALLAASIIEDEVETNRITAFVMDAVAKAQVQKEAWDIARVSMGMPYPLLDQSDSDN